MHLKEHTHNNKKRNISENRSINWETEVCQKGSIKEVGVKMVIIRLKKRNISEEEEYQSNMIGKTWKQVGVDSEQK